MKIPPFIKLIAALATTVFALLTHAHGSSPYVGSAEALEGFDSITPEQMEELRGKRILFASRSFGLNMYNGLNSINNQDSDYDYVSSYIRYNVLNAGGDLTIIPDDVYDSYNFVHFLATYWPHNKRLEEVDTLLRDAPWNFGNKVDVVLIYFHTAGPTLYDEYIATMEALQQDFPDVKFIYVCPAYMGPSRTTDNQNAYELGELLRANQRGNVPLYDLAAILSKDNLELKHYVPEYSTDSADVHPNTDAGQTALAKGFLVMLKELYFAAEGEAPTAPTNLAGQAASDTAINLTWTASTITEGNVSYYRVVRDGQLVTTTSSTSLTDTGLTEGTSYNYTVNAVSNTGVHSPVSNTLSVQTLADTTAPTLLSAADTEIATQVKLTFSEDMEPASAENAANYTIAGITVNSASLSGDTVTLTTSTLAEETTYTVQVSNVRDNSSANNAIAAGAQDNFRHIPPTLPTPIGHWAFNGNLNDSIGGNNGGWLNGADSYGTGYFGQGLTQDGSTDDSPHVRIPDAMNQNAMSELAVSVWAKKNTAGTGGQLFKKHVAFDMSITDDSVVGYVYTAGAVNNAFNVTVPSINDTNWHHYALVYNGTTLKVYVDGNEVSSQPATGVTNSTTQPIYVGKLPWGSFLTFNGQIDELKLFNQAFDPAAIYESDKDHAAVQALLTANNVGRTVDGVSVKNSEGRIIELYLQEGGITEITADIGQLTELLLLHCYGDRLLEFPLLTTIDPALAACTKLQTLLINQNDLSTLPTEITNLTTLTSFSAGENRLADITDPVRSWLDTYDPDWLSTQLNNSPSWSEYLSKHFTAQEEADPMISGDGIDIDFDGLPNLIEYFLQSDPRSSDSTGLMSSGMAGGTFSIRLNRIRDDSGLTVQWLYSSNLTNWSPITPTDVRLIQDMGAYVEYAYDFDVPDNDDDCHFFRLSVDHVETTPEPASSLSYDATVDSSSGRIYEDTSTSARTVKTNSGTYTYVGNVGANNSVAVLCFMLPDYPTDGTITGATFSTYLNTIANSPGNASVYAVRSSNSAGVQASDYSGGTLVISDFLTTASGTGRVTVEKTASTPLVDWLEANASPNEYVVFRIEPNTTQTSYSRFNLSDESIAGEAPSMSIVVSTGSPPDPPPVPSGWGNIAWDPTPWSDADGVTWESMSTLNSEIQGTSSGGTLDLTGRFFRSLPNTEHVSISSPINIIGGYFSGATSLTWTSVGGGVYKANIDLSTMGSSGLTMLEDPDTTDVPQLAVFPAPPAGTLFEKSRVTSNPNWWALRDGTVGTSGTINKATIHTTGGDDSTSYSHDITGFTITDATIRSAVDAAIGGDIDSMLIIYHAGPNQIFTDSISSWNGTTGKLTLGSGGSANYPGYFEFCLTGRQEFINGEAGAYVLDFASNEVYYKPADGNPTGTGIAVNPVIFKISTDGVSFTGSKFSATNGRVAAAGMLVGTSAYRTTFDSCTFMLGNDAIRSLEVDIDLCQFSHLYGRGMAAQPGSTITRNRFEHIEGSSMLISRSSGEINVNLAMPATLIEGNYFYQPTAAHGQGISLYSCTWQNATVRNNIFHSCARAISFQPYSSNASLRTLVAGVFRFENNLIWTSELPFPYDNGQATVAFNGAQDTHLTSGEQDVFIRYNIVGGDTDDFHSRVFNMTIHKFVHSNVWVDGNIAGSISAADLDANYLVHQHSANLLGSAFPLTQYGASYGSTDLPHADSASVYDRVNLAALGTAATAASDGGPVGIRWTVIPKPTEMEDLPLDWVDVARPQTLPTTTAWSDAFNNTDDR